MTDLSILIPGLLLGLYTMGFFFFMGLTRRAAIVGKEISIKYYRTYDQGREPERLKVLTRHASNLLETPVLFYAGLLFVVVSGATNAFFTTLAWLYLAARVLHAFIHLGSNNITHRFLAFGTSLIILLVMWVGVLVHVVGGTG
jgi:hypothetical protein